MRYLVTSLPPASNSIRTPNVAIFSDTNEADASDLARAEAERLLLADHTEVTVWKHSATPSLTRTVNWGED